VIDGIDHVLLSGPPGCEPEARLFYGGVLGLAEVPKPESLAGRGGCWFSAGAQQLHIGVEEPFNQASKAHPALTTHSIEEVASALEAAGCALRWDDALDGVDRFYVDDPFGNRIEIVGQPGELEAGPD
jgi:catechol 2,3-dioxygenase-like lactoylglutathione lyase family enzyme